MVISQILSRRILSRLGFFNERKDVKERESLGHALCSALDKYTRTLFILDGLDEVSREWNSDTHPYDFLRMLLNEKDVIITSQPLDELQLILDKQFQQRMQDPALYKVIRCKEKYKGFNIS